MNPSRRGVSCSKRLALLCLSVGRPFDFATLKAMAGFQKLAHLQKPTNPSIMEHHLNVVYKIIKDILTRHDSG